MVTMTTCKSCTVCQQSGQLGQQTGVVLALAEELLSNLFRKSLGRMKVTDTDILDDDMNQCMHM